MVTVKQKENIVGAIYLIDKTDNTITYMVSLNRKGAEIGAWHGSKAWIFGKNIDCEIDFDVPNDWTAHSSTSRYTMFVTFVRITEELPKPIWEDS